MSSDSEPEVGILPVTSSRSRRRQLPAQFRDDDDSDGNDGVLCTICGFNEPEGLSSCTIFWIDSDICGSWVHNICAFGHNTVTRHIYALLVRNEFFFLFLFSFFLNCCNEITIFQKYYLVKIH